MTTSRISLLHTIALFFFLAFAPLVSTHAQNPDQCDAVNGGNFSSCCTTPLSSDIARRCTAYEQSPQYCIDFPDDSQCTPINGPQGGGATQQSAPLNGGVGSGFFSESVGLSEGLDASACSAITFKSAINILIWIKCIIVVVLIPLLFSAAFLVFLWGVFKFMTSSDAKGKQEGQKVIWWGMLGLFVMVSVWGIIKIVGNVLGIESAVPFLQTEYLKQ